MGVFSKFLKSKNSSVKQDKLNRHFIFIEESADLIAAEIILWGEAFWWPKNSVMQFTRLTPGEIRVGTRYRQQVLLPFAPSWEVEVTKFDPQGEIERTFLSGMFKGKETVRLEERYNGTKVDYLMQYQIQGVVNKILWLMVFQKMHDQNLEMILKSLRDYIMKKKEANYL